MAAVIERLPDLVKDTRKQRRMSLRDVRARTGVAIHTLSDLENQKQPHMSGLTIIRLLRWLGEQG